MAVVEQKIEEEVEVRENLTFILSHTDGLWPRTISTYSTKGAQILVNSLEEAMKWFKASNFIDCRINAYAKYTDYYINRTGIAPTVLLVDREHFKTIEDFELAVTNTYNNFYTRLGSRPTQLATGGGVHFLTPQRAPVFEKLPRFEKFRAEGPSRKFMQFEERLFSNDKADQSHWSTVSFYSCMLRIPGTLNYSCFKLDDRGKIIDIPYEAKVRVVKNRDGNIPIVSQLLVNEYYNYLQFAAIRSVREQRVRESQYNKYCYGRARECINLYGYDYIERLFNKPLGDFRKFCIWRVFVPYFINVKRLPGLEAFNRTKSWLDKSNSVSRLNFNPVWRIDYAINHVGTHYPPWEDSLEQINKPFYELLKTAGIIIDNRVTN